MSISASPHLRGIVIAGVLAAVAVALGFVTLGMNQSSSSAATHTVLSLKARHLASAAVTPKPVTKTPAKKVVHKAPNAHLVAALKAGLPRSVAKGLGESRAVVVSLTSSNDSVAEMANAESKAGALLEKVPFVQISVDREGGDAAALTSLLGALPAAPATLVYVRPGTLFVQLSGFNDRGAVQQAASNALRAPAGTTTVPAPSAAPVATTPAATTPATTPPAPAAA